MGETTGPDELLPRIVHAYEEILRDDGTVEMSYNYLDYFLVPEANFQFDGAMFYARHYLDEPGDVIIMCGEPGDAMMDYLQARFERILRPVPGAMRHEPIWERIR